MHPALQLSPEITEAMAQGRAIVALESTIIAHGMPYPQNVATAREVEALIRHEGAVPATIAVFEGRIHVGLTAEELEQLGTAKQVAKVSRRDLPQVLASGAMGVCPAGRASNAGTATAGVTSRSKRCMNWRICEPSAPRRWWSCCTCNAL